MENEKMIVLNSLKFDKDYTKLTDDMSMESLKPLEEYGLTREFYGGTVTHIGKLKRSKVFLLIDAETDGLQIKDIAVEDFDSFNFNLLKEFAESKGIEFKPVGTSKEELIDKIKKVTLVLN